ncbi:MAG: FAD-dependent oxidoreductase, partial [Planctomycetes bacterium]|nr:FAD-dependent oxidoreductase [Planctomycetota bacterium]
MGFVAPRREGRAMMARSFSQEKYYGRAPPGQVLLRAFLGGARNPDVAERAEGALIADVRRDLSDLLGITGEPEVVSLRRHAVAMAQYEVGHLARVARVEAALGRHVGLALAGNGLRGVGVPDCIESGERAAARVVEEMESRRAP